MFIPRWDRRLAQKEGKAGMGSPVGPIVLCLGASLLAATAVAAPAPMGARAALTARPLVMSVPAASHVMRHGAPPFMPAPGVLASERQSLIAEINSASIAPASPSRGAGQPPPSARNVLGGQSPQMLANIPCSQQAPFIGEVKGSVTPGGAVGVKGLCFGDSGGVLRLYGAFPGGYLTLPTLAWSDKEVAGQVPDISGVLDQAVTVRLMRSDNRESNDARTVFHPTLVAIIVPVQLIQLTRCGGVDASECLVAPSPGGNHIFLNTPPPQPNDYDSWSVTLAKGWDVTELDWDEVNVTAVTGLDDPLPPEQLRAEIHWTIGQPVRIHSDGNCMSGPFMVSCSTGDLLWSATYDIQIRALGPVGVSPYPSP